MFSNKGNHNNQKGDAGLHYVAAKLSQLGCFVYLPTNGRAPADLLVIYKGSVLRIESKAYTHVKSWPTVRQQANHDVFASVSLKTGQVQFQPTLDAALSRVKPLSSYERTILKAVRKETK